MATKPMNDDDEADRAKAENESNKRKQRVEEKQADANPTGEVFPEQKVTSDRPDPSVDPVLNSNIPNPKRG